MRGWKKGIGFWDNLGSMLSYSLYVIVAVLVMYLLFKWVLGD